MESEVRRHAVSEVEGSPPADAGGQDEERRAQTEHGSNGGARGQRAWQTAAVLNSGRDVCRLISIQTDRPIFEAICLCLKTLGMRPATQHPTWGAAWEEAIELALEDVLKEVLR